MKITVWDDEPRAARKWKTQLERVLSDDAVTIEAPNPEEIESELRILHDRRKAYLDTENVSVQDRPSDLDSVDILIVDNDLFALPHLRDFSAETVASRAGVYTTCGYIVVLNLRPDVDFDLTLLGHPRSKADLHINDRFVADQGLWHSCPRSGGTFRPWHWPLLLDVVAPYRSRVEDLKKLLESDDGNQPILDYLGFGRNARNRLSRSARAFLHPKIPVSEISFVDFVSDNVNAVGVKDGKRILERKDVLKMAQIGARRIAKWLGHLVLGPQDILIDFPHLVERMPFVVPEEQKGCTEFWNSCAKLSDAPLRIVEERLGIGEACFKKWIDRPVYWTELLETEENLERMLDIADSNPNQLVFCEDSSAFHIADSCDEFVAAHNSMMDGRFVRWFVDEKMDIKFAPQSRFAN